MPDALITPELLERHFVVRPKTANWSQVKTARDTLNARAQQDAPYGDMERDKNNVVEYASMLTASGRALSAAICLAADLQRYRNSTDPAPKTDAALQAISAGLQLQGLSDENREAELVRCAGELLANADFPSIAPDDPLKSVSEWKTKVDGLLQQVKRTAYRSPIDAQTDAWTAWNRRLAAFAQGREEPADLNCLRCRAFGLPAGTILPARLAGAGVLCQASEALLASLASPPQPAPLTIPLAFGLGLIRALGFDTPMDLVAPHLSDTSIQQFFETQKTVPSVQSSVKALLIIRQLSASRTTNWLILPSQPTLVVPSDKWFGLFDGQPDLRNFLSPRLAGVLFEAEPGQSAPDAAKRFSSKIGEIRSYLPNVQCGLLLTRAVDNPDVIPAQLRRFSVAPQSQIEAAKAFLT